MSLARKVSRVFHVAVEVAPLVSFSSHCVDGSGDGGGVVLCDAGEFARWDSPSAI